VSLRRMWRSEADGGLALIEKHATRQSPSRVEELVAIFIHATKVSSLLF